MAFTTKSGRNSSSAVNVPISYVFRPEPRNWTLADARVVAWADRYRQLLEEEAEDMRKAAGQIVLPPIRRVPILALLGSEIRLEVRDVDNPSAGSFMNVERGFPPVGLLPLAATLENTPDLRSEWFRVFVDRSLPLLDEDRSISERLTPDAVYPERDPWLMQHEFFQLRAADNDALLSFLRKWGEWGRPDHDGLLMAAMRHLYRPQDFWSFQDRLRNRVRLPAKKWLKTASRLPAWNSSEHPTYVLTQGWVKNALEDTITLEKMKETEHAICERPGCGNIITKTGKRPKRFCDESCALKLRQQRFWEKKSALNLKAAGADKKRIQHNAVIRRPVKKPTAQQLDVKSR